MDTYKAAGGTTSAPACSGAGLRRTTPGSVRSRKHARAYHREGASDVSRSAALKMVKLAGPVLGIGPIKLALLDQLFASSKAMDWSDAGGIGPVVWPSNAWLARRMGAPVNTVRYHLRGLTDAGLITWRDGPTCRRHGKRDADGRIVEAFGIDLSPLAMRYEEFSAIVEASEEEAKEMKRFRRRRTVLDKDIRSLIASAREHGLDDDTEVAFCHAMARREVLCERCPRDLDGLMRQVAALEALYDELEALYDRACRPTEPQSDVSKTGHRGVKMLTPNTTTAPTSNSEICNQNGIAHNRRVNPTNMDDTQLHNAACGRMAFEKKPAANPQENKQSQVEAVDSAGDLAKHPAVADGNGSVEGAGFETNAADDDVLHLSIGLLRDACPAIEGAAPGALADWQALRGSGSALCAGADINPQVFEEASDALGPDIAIAATAVTVQKAAQGDVFNPGAYLRTLTKRGKAGQLRIARSLHGLAGKNADNPAGDRVDGSADMATDPDPEAAPPTADTFPPGGSIAFGKWADIVRQKAPKPTPDVDRVADEFRRFCRRSSIDMTSPNIATVFATFARKWKERL